MSRTLPSASLDSKNFWRFWLIILAVVACFVVVGTGLVMIGPDVAMKRADAGFAKAKRTIDPEQLRAWALEMIQNFQATNGSRTISPTNVPPFIKTLYSSFPQILIAPESSENEERVGIMWGGGFFHWGLHVGSTNFIMDTNSYPGTPRSFKWVNGIYYTRESNKDLR